MMKSVAGPRGLSLHVPASGPSTSGRAVSSAVPSRVRCRSHSEDAGTPASVPRRSTLLAAIAAMALAPAPARAEGVDSGRQASACGPPEPFQPPDYSMPGPFATASLPRLEHVCTKCAPACTGSSCLVRCDFIYPKGAGKGPYPLAIITGGFLISSGAYRSYAEHLASYGYTVLLYDKGDTLSDLLDDVTSSLLLRDLIDWSGSDALISRIADSSRVYLVSAGVRASAPAAPLCMLPYVALPGRASRSTQVNEPADLVRCWQHAWRPRCFR